MISETHLSNYSRNYKKVFEPLDVSTLLINNPILQHEPSGILPQSSLDHGQGFDNVAFDLEGLEKIEPGSRKPLVGIHVRTVSAEEFVRSTLHSQSTRSRRCDGWSLDGFPVNQSSNIYKNDFCNFSSLDSNRGNTLAAFKKEDNFTKVKNNINITNSLHKNPLKSDNSVENRFEQGRSVNIISDKGLPSNATLQTKKTDIFYKQKTESGSALSARKEICGTSLTETMVRVGGVTAGVSPPFSQNVNVSICPKVVISSVGSITSPTSVSQVSVMNSGVGISTKVSNVVLSGSVISSPSTSSSTFASSVVSALSKVSSVRIVPSPNNTPTPSVIGVTPASSSAVAPEDVPNSPTPAATTTPIKKSSQAYRPFVAVKRHLNNLKNNDQSPQPNTRLPTQQSTTSLLGLLTNNNHQHPATTSNTIQNQNNQGTTINNTSDLLQQQQQQSQSLNQQPLQTVPDPLRGSVVPPNGNATTNVVPTEGPDNLRRGGRERRRERRERRRERRALRIVGGPNIIPGPPIQTDLGHESRPHPPHLPDLLNSHIPPPYSTLPNGPRSLGGLLGPPPPVGAPPPIPIQMPPPPPPGPPLPPLGPYPPPPPPGPSHGSPLRVPIPVETPWHIFGSRRSRGSRRGHSYLGDEEAKACCGLLVTQAVSIRWFIIMISFVGLCCTVVGTVLGAVKTNSSEYVTITLLMIGVGIVLITVSGVAWHLTSRDAPCRVMLGLSPNDSGRGETRRFMSRMAPTFGRPHHPYAAMMYPEFQYRPPPPSYQASMQEYRLRLFLLDRHGTGGQQQQQQQQYPSASNLPSPPPTYRSGPYNIRALGVGTLSRESDYSRPPSYRSREGSVTHHPDIPPSVDPSGGGGGLTPVHSRNPSCLSFLSNEGSTRLRGNLQKRGSTTNSTKFAVVDANCNSDSGSPASSGSKKGENTLTKDDNTVTIVQTTDCSHVIGSESVIVTVSGNELTNQRTSNNNSTEISVLAHL